MFQRFDQVLCLSVVDTMIGLSIVLVCHSNIKVLWCCLYVILSWETEADLIVFKHQRRRQIRFKEIVTPHKTQHPPFYSPDKPYFSYNFIFFVIFPFPYYFVSMYLHKFVTIYSFIHILEAQHKFLQLNTTMKTLYMTKAQFYKMAEFHRLNLSEAKTL